MIENIKMSPFFIVGAPRSGTTMLRDIFKQVKGLYSPEETHIFRWAAPFKGNEYEFIYNNNKILKMHREIDEVSAQEFDEIYRKSNTKAAFNDAYCSFVAQRKGKEFWFEKSPQNVYGLPLIAALYDDIKIVHIVRHPYDVIKSLNVGKVLKVDSVAGAANYWFESVAIVNVIKPFLKDRLIEVKYEDLVHNSEETVKNLCDSLGIGEVEFKLEHINASEKVYSDFFSHEEFEIIHEICEKYMELYGYTKV